LKCRVCGARHAMAATAFEQRYVKLEVRPLGTGTYGEVFKVNDTQTNTVMAMKRMKLEHEEEGIPSTAIREIAVLKELHHVNVVRLYDVHCSQKKLLLVFEYVANDLKRFLRANKPLSAATICNLFKQLIVGLEFCHARRVIHRDLKPANLLIDDAGTLKVADFGLARAFGVPMPKYTHEVITVWYRAPEILLGSEKYALPVDVWSTGTILAEMVTGAPCFPGDCEVDTLFKIFRRLGTPSDAAWRGVRDLKDFKGCFPQWRVMGWNSPSERYASALGPDGIDLLSQTLLYQPGDRISARTALGHRYFDQAP